jgi:hypothetical protein
MAKSVNGIAPNTRCKEPKNLAAQLA